MNNKSIVIDAKNLGKQYRIGAQRAKYKSLRDEITRGAASLASRLRHPRANRNSQNYFWALRDISFEILRGETVGVIGRNGSGKSTLLKLISGITYPSAGYATIRGRVGSLLEVGTGFHPELTGRENIYLNGAIIGMKKVEIDRKFDDIVSFAEISRFLDTPVKHYSSGMYVRLAFAVAAHLEPEILLVDEVLAVGDAAFQKKCLGKMEGVVQEGRTILFVSHNMSAVKQLCTRGILLNSGTVAYDGSIDEAVEQYVTIAQQDVASETVFEADPSQPMSITRLSTRNEQGDKTAYFSSKESITVEIEYRVHEPLRDDHIFIILDRADGLLVLKTSDDDNGRETRMDLATGRYISRATFPGGILNEGYYRFRVVLGKRKGVKHDEKTSAYFEVEDTNDYTRSVFGKRNGALLLPLRWDDCFYEPFDELT